MKNILRLNINSNRVYGLDILRALAIFFVVVAHAHSFLPAGLKQFSMALQYDGVAIFFVLSGFLIGGILIKLLEKERASFKVLLNFWIRRWFRTLPAYFLVLTILSILYLNFTNYYSFTEIKSYYLFTQNLFSPHPQFFPEAWSLSVEEWFYILIPICIFSLSKFLGCTVRQSVLYTALGVIIIITAYRIVKFNSIETFDANTLKDHFRKQVFTRLDSIMYGLIGAFLAHFHKTKWLKHKVILLTVGIAIFIFDKYHHSFFNLMPVYNYVLSFSVISLATLFLLPFLSDLKKGEGIFHNAATYISLISYSMYLLNLSVHTLVDKISLYGMTGAQPAVFQLVNYFLFWALTILSSLIMYKYFELPFMNLRDRFKPRRRT